MELETKTFTQWLSLELSLGSLRTDESKSIDIFVLCISTSFVNICKGIQLFLANHTLCNFTRMQ